MRSFFAMTILAVFALFGAATTAPVLAAVDDYLTPDCPCTDCVCTPSCQCLPSDPDTPEQPVLSSATPLAPASPFLCLLGAAAAVLPAVNAGKTSTKRIADYKIPDGALNTMSFDELRREHESLMTICEAIESDPVFNSIGGDDLKTYEAAIKRTEEVAAAYNSHPQGLAAKRKQSTLVQNAQQLGLQHVTVTNMAEGHDHCGYGEGLAGEQAFLRDVVIAYENKTIVNSDRFKEAVRRTVVSNRLKGNPDKSQATRQQVLNAIGDDEYSFHRWQDGGLLIPKAYRAEIRKLPLPSEMLSDKCTQVPMEVPELSIPAYVDKNHSTSYTGGTRVYRKGEFQTAGKSKDQFEEINLKATELIGATAVSNMLARYSPISIAAMMTTAFRAAFDYKRMEEFLFGDGQGRPLGMFHANNLSLKTILREAGQGAADIVNGKNVLRMRQSCWRYDQSYWIMNPDLLFYIAQLHIESTNNAGIIQVPFFSPGKDGQPDTILGRPVLVTEHMTGITAAQDGNAISEWTEGFLGLVNPTEYAYSTLYEEEMESAHVRFEEREKVYLWVRCDTGMPLWKSVLTPVRGVTTLSPFLLLSKTVMT